MTTTTFDEINTNATYFDDYLLEETVKSFSNEINFFPNEKCKKTVKNLHIQEKEAYFYIFNINKYAVILKGELTDGNLKNIQNFMDWLDNWTNDGEFNECKNGTDIVDKLQELWDAFTCHKYVVDFNMRCTVDYDCLDSIDSEKRIYFDIEKM